MDAGNQSADLTGGGSSARRDVDTKDLTEQQVGAYLDVTRSGLAGSYRLGQSIASSVSYPPPVSGGAGSRLWVPAARFGHQVDDHASVVAVPGDPGGECVEKRADSVEALDTLLERGPAGHSLSLIRIGRGRRP